MKQNVEKHEFLKIMVVTVTIILFSILYSVIFYFSTQKRLLSTLDELSEQSAFVLQKEADKEKSIVTNIAKIIGDNHISDADAFLRVVNGLTEINSFKRIGIVNSSGNAITTDGVPLQVSDRDYFKLAMTGKTVISDSLKDKTDGGSIIVYSAPIYEYDHIVSVLFATYDTSRYNSFFSTTAFNGTGFTYVVKPDGTLMIDGTGGNIDTHEGGNLLDDMLQTDSRNTLAVNTLRSAMAQSKEGSFVYHNGEKTYMYYRALGVNDWYLLCNVPAVVLEKELNGNLVLFYIYILICGVVVLLMVIRMFHMGKDNQKALEDIAYVDKVTGGMTYDKWIIDAKAILRQAPPSSYAVLCLNIEKFKYINDLFGFEEGNSTLRFIWKTIRDNLDDRAILARQTGDHFVILTPYTKKQMLQDTAEAIYLSIHNRVCESDKYYELKPSIGIYCVEPDITDIPTMVDRANTALASIKSSIFEHIAFYDSKLRDNILKNKVLEDRFSDAIKNHEFEVYYQPKKNTVTGEFEGAEALVRWVSPLYGIISPGDFIPVFERNGDVLTLDRYVFREVCSHIRTWLELGWTVYPISVNLSRLHLYQPAYIKHYIHILEEYQIPQGLVELEITETALFESEDVMIKSIYLLRDYGIKILMDDFGTGYSSINMLKSLPIDVLKVDKSLVDDSVTNRNSQMILKYIIQLSHELGIQVTAEGVETKDQFDLITSLGGDFIQGYFCARPLPKRDYEKILNSQPT